ncbi:MAG: autotransporter domain-containing protein, partial [Deltaproteobacteria bacterium]|nr:autotransporter domain-containing protein [Deltaproteobacteria bacterium]
MGEGSINKIYNDANIEVVADVDATASAASVTLAGASQADVSASGDAEATGISLGMGSGGIGNFGAVDVDATADMTSTASGFDLAGATHSDITVGATSQATGLHGGDGAGDSCIYNASSVDANAHSTMTVHEDNVGLFGYAGTTGTAGADATSFGIAGGLGNDYADNVSTIHSSATSAMTQTDSTFTFAGSSSSGGSLTASTDAYGMDGNAGNDTLSTSGRIDAIAHSSFTAGSNANNVFGQASGATGTSGAFSNAFGIAGDAGTDNIEVESLVNSHATSSLTQTGSTFTFGGASSTGGTLTGLSQAFGVDTGDDSDYVIGSGSLKPTAVSTFHMSGSAHNVFGTSGASGSAGATTHATGINTGAGADYVDSDINITASADSTVHQSASTFTFGGATKAGLTVKAESSATGIDGGDSDDYIEERGDITLKVTSSLTETGSTFAFGGASNAVANVHASSYATGIDGGSGNDMIINRGAMKAGLEHNHTARLDFTGHSSAAFGTASTSGFLGAASSLNGIVGGSGDDVLANFGSIELQALSLVFENASSFTFAGGSGVGGKFAAEGTVIGMDAGSGHDFVRNEGQITSTVVSFLEISGNSVAGLGAASASETSGAVSTAKGIVGGSGDDNIENLSTINVNAGSNLGVYSSSFTAIGGSGNKGKIKSTASSYGITGDSGSDKIVSEGAINIGGVAEMTSHIRSSVGAGDAEESAQSDASFYSVGLSGGGSDDSIRNANTVHMTGNVNIDSENTAEAVAGYAKCTATANGYVTAEGLNGGTGNDIFVNDGTIHMDLESKVKGTATADAKLGLVTDAHMTATADATLIGIYDPSGTSHIVNNGTIDVDATADCEAHASAKVDGISEPSRAHRHAYANAYAYGIKTGSEHDMIYNHGHINVNATANSNTGNRTTVAVAISSGAGNDTVVNSGTVSALTDQDGTPGYGISIDTGSGHDTLALLDGTSLEGSVILGHGDDSLVLTGSPVVTNGVVFAGTIGDPFSGYDTATLYGSGTFTGVLFGFDEALKTGIGTYTVPELPVSVVEVIEGTLVVDDDYDFSLEGKYTAHINPDGNCGAMQINGAATLSGDMKIVADRGAFVDGTEYKVLTSDTSSGAFSRLEVPNTPILTFEPEQNTDSLDIEVDVASFETVADNSAEQSIAGYLDRLTPTSSGELNDVIGEFQRLSRPQFDRAFASVSPEQYSESSREYRENSRKSFRALRGRLNSLRKSAAFASARSGADPTVNLAALAGVPEKPCGLWHKGFVTGFSQEQPGIATLMPITDDFSSFGFDAAFGKKFVAGFGGDQSEVSTTSELAYGEGVVDGSRHFAYGSYTLDDHFYMDIGMFKGEEDYSHQRELTIGALEGSTASEHDGESYSSYIETGGLLNSRSAMLQPFGSLEYIYFREDGFTESGGGPLALRIEDTERDLLVSHLGVRATKMWTADDWTIMPEISLAWRYDIDSADYSTTASFVSAPGQYFVIDGKEDSPHALAIGASLDIGNYGKFRSILDVTGELFTDDNRYDVEWRLEYNF